MVRELDLKKPPSIAESIDWARALLLLGADDIDAQVFTDTMSIIVKHRTDLDVVAERVGMKLARPAACHARRLAGARRSTAAATPTRRRPGSARASSSSARSCAARASRSARASCSTPSPSCARSPGREPVGLPRGAGRDAGQVPGGPADLRPRLRPLLLPRRRDGGRPRGRRRGRRDGRRGRRAQPRDAAPADRPGAARRRGGAMRDLARLAIAAFGRQGEGSGVIGVDVQRIRRALGLRAEPQPDLPPDDPRAEGLPRDAIRRFEALLRQELERAPDRAHRGAAARAAAQRARPRAAQRAAAGPRRRAPRRRPAQAPPEDPGPGAARAQAPRPRRRAQDDARVAGDRRRAGRPASTSRCARGARRSTCCATSRRQRHERERLLPLRPARAARLVSQDALVRLHRAHQRGHRRLRARARLQGRQRGDRPRRRRRRHLAATPTTAACGASSATLVEDDLHPRATVIVLGDARTNGRDPRADVFAQVAAQGRAHLLAEPRAAAVLELRRLGHRGLRAPLRGLRVLDDRPARGLRQGADAPGRAAPERVVRCRRDGKRESAPRGSPSATARRSPSTPSTSRSSRARCSATSGPNGAGKTTTIRLLLGLHRPTSGPGRALRHRRLARPGARPPARRLRGRRAVPVAVAHRRRDARLPRAVRGRHGRRLPRRADRALPPRPRQEGPRAVEGQPPEGAARSRRSPAAPTC